jgi:hypothetical protein
MAGMMRRTSFAFALTLALVLGSAGSALAQGRAGRGAGSGGPLGVGIHAMLDPGAAFGPSVVYDTGVFHVEGILAFDDVNNVGTTFDIGGHFWYHINSSQAADFSLGGGLGIISFNPDQDGADSQTDIEIDAGAQIRVFLVPNVALSASLGLALITGDNDSTSLTGEPTGAAGITYFF